MIHSSLKCIFRQKTKNYLGERVNYNQIPHYVLQATNSTIISSDSPKPPHDWVLKTPFYSGVREVPHLPQVHHALGAGAHLSASLPSSTCPEGSWRRDPPTQRPLPAIARCRLVQHNPCQEGCYKFCATPIHTAANGMLLGGEG